MTSKFWPKNSPGFHLGNPRMTITTRDRGDIPGCTMALREGVYRPVLQAEARNECTRRCTQYANDVSAYIHEDLPKEQIFRSFNKSMYGAYGEKL